MINQLISKHIAEAFDNQLGDAVSSFKGYRKGAAGGYDAVSDTYVQGTDVNYVGRGVFDSYSQEEIQASQIDITDVKLWCLQSELTSLPAVDDTVTRASGWQGRILSIEQDPVCAGWTIQLRAAT